MWTMLAGVPGKLKTLIDRLTATRAANLDKLDANITTRAPASTALTNAVWSDARAGKLDKIDGLEADAQYCTDDPTSRPPIAGGMVSTTTVAPGVVNFGGLAETLSAGTTHSYSGAGVIELIALHNSSGAPVAASITVTIDGVVAFTYAGSVAATSGRFCAGFVRDGAAAFSQIPFRTSLTIACTGVSAYYRYYKVA